MSASQVVDITQLATLGEQFPVRLMRLGYRLMQVIDEAGHDQVRYVIPPVCTVPAGPFLMGSDKQRDPQAMDNELPQHEVSVPAFQLGTYPMTVAEYACAVQSGVVQEPRVDPVENITWSQQQDRPDHPVFNITWYQATAYAAWLAQVTGLPWRLPTEAEWEKAARGTDGRIYPWGDMWDATRANTSSDDIVSLMPVGNCPQGASPYGVQDMAGSVWEWTSSCWVKRYPYRSDVSEDAASSASERVMRGGGGSFGNGPLQGRVACRVSTHADNVNYNRNGVRLALSVAANT